MTKNKSTPKSEVTTLQEVSEKLASGEIEIPVFQREVGIWKNRVLDEFCARVMDDNPPLSTLISLGYVKETGKTLVIDGLQRMTVAIAANDAQNAFYPRLTKALTRCHVPPDKFQRRLNAIKTEVRTIHCRNLLEAMSEYIGLNSGQIATEGEKLKGFITTTTHGPAFFNTVKSTVAATFGAHPSCSRGISRATTNSDRWPVFMFYVWLRGKPGILSYDLVGRHQDGRAQFGGFGSPEENIRDWLEMGQWTWPEIEKKIQSFNGVLGQALAVLDEVHSEVATKGTSVAASMAKAMVFSYVLLGRNNIPQKQAILRKIATVAFRGTITKEGGVGTGFKSDNGATIRTSSCSISEWVSGSGPASKIWRQAMGERKTKQKSQAARTNRSPLQRGYDYSHVSPNGKKTIPELSSANRSRGRKPMSASDRQHLKTS